MRRPCSVHPKTFVKAGRLDNESVTLPVSSGIAVITGHKIGRMRLPIEEDLAESMRPTYIENENLLELGHLDDFGSIGSHKLTGATGRFAARVRLEFVISPIVIESLRPRLVWRLGIRKTAAASSPNSFFSRKSAHYRMPVRPTWGWF